jgi:hypothetical protein
MIQAMGGTCYGYVCDLCNREDVYKQASSLTKEVGRVRFRFPFIALCSYFKAAHLQQSRYKKIREASARIGHCTRQENLMTIAF